MVTSLPDKHSHRYVSRIFSDNVEKLLDILTEPAKYSCRDGDIPNQIKELPMLQLHLNYLFTRKGYISES